MSLMSFSPVSSSTATGVWGFQTSLEAFGSPNLSSSALVTSLRLPWSQ